MSNYKDIKNFEGFYTVSDDGKVWSCPRTYTLRRKGLRKIGGFFLQATKNRSGYYRVRLQRKGFLRQVFIHVLVAETFLKKTKTCLQVNHKNGVKNDNRLENLEWVTPRQNVQHSFDVLNRQSLKGEKSHRAKLTWSEVFKIRSTREKGLTYQKISGLFNIHKSTIAQICRKKTWV